MSKITSTRKFESVLATTEERREECQEWMDGVTEVEHNTTEDSVFCFVETADSRSVKMLRFATTEDMDLEMGELIPELNGQRIYEPVFA
jgi:hypothetical protein